MPYEMMPGQLRGSSYTTVRRGLPQPDLANAEPASYNKDVREEKYRGPDEYARGRVTGTLLRIVQSTIYIASVCQCL